MKISEKYISIIQTKEVKHNMVNVILKLTLCLVFMGSCKASKDSSSGNIQQGELYTVAGVITRSESYCGGAEPEPGLLEELRKPGPYSGKKLYVKSGDANALKHRVLDSIVAQADGTYELQLPPGKYCLIQSTQLDRKVFEKYGKGSNISLTSDTCLENWWNRCYYAFTVTDRNIDSLNFHFHKPCFVPEGMPCLDYSGPLPP